VTRWTVTAPVPRRWRHLIPVVVAGLLASAAGCANRADPVPDLVIASGGVGGVYHAYATGLAGVLADELDTGATVLATAASVENLRMITAGRADICFTLADSAALAVEGSGPFPEHQPIAALARLYDNYTHLVVAADAPINHVSDLRGHAVSTGARDSGTELMAERLLTLGGVDQHTDITRHRLALAESADALRHGHIQAFFWSGGLPTAAISELATTTDIRLLDLSEYVEPLRVRFGELFTELSIPAFTYGLSREVATIGVPNLLVVHEDMDQAVAEAVTRQLFDHKDRLIAAHPEAERLNPRTAIATYPVPLHPGAAAYYRSAKPRV
jgi:uncharacterized protein